MWLQWWISGSLKAYIQHNFSAIRMCYALESTTRKFFFCCSLTWPIPARRRPVIESWERNVGIFKPYKEIIAAHLITDYCNKIPILEGGGHRPRRLAASRSRFPKRDNNCVDLLGCTLTDRSFPLSDQVRPSNWLSNNLIPRQPRPVTFLFP